MNVDALSFDIASSHFDVNVVSARGAGFDLINQLAHLRRAGRGLVRGF